MNDHARFVQQLTDTGLTDKEARCYAALLKLGEGTAYKVALVAGLKKPITYAVLEELRKRGLVLVIPHHKKRLYIAQDPDTYLSGIASTLQALKRTLPLVVAQAHAHAAPTLVFEGARGIKDALAHRRNELRDCEILAFYGRSSKPLVTVPRLFAEDQRILMSQGCTRRAIAPRHESLALFRQLDKEVGHEVRELDTDIFDLNATIEITPLFVRVLSHADKTAVIMSSPHIVAACKGIFECVWKLTGPRAARP